MDLKTSYDNEARGGDLAFDGALLEMDGGLETAILHSLFSDRRATVEDVKTYGLADRRGWWGDLTLAREGEQYGSRLWLLNREKQTPAVLRRAEEYASEALEWLVSENVAINVQVAAEIIREGVLGLQIVITLIDGSTFKNTYEV